jgi:hypothetical protein
MLLVSRLFHLMIHSSWYLILIRYMQSIIKRRLLCLKYLIVLCFWDKLTWDWDLFIYIIHSFFTFFLWFSFIAFRRIRLLIIVSLIINDCSLNFIWLFIFVRCSLILGCAFLFWGLLFPFFTSYRRLTMSFVLLSQKNWIDPESIIKKLDDWHLPLGRAWDFSLSINIRLCCNFLLVSFRRRRLH